MDDSGLMAPIGSKARLEYEKQRKKEEALRGPWGLVKAVAEPLSWLPGIPGALARGADTASDIAAEGWEAGLTRALSSVAPFVKNAPSKLNVVVPVHPKYVNQAAVDMVKKAGLHSPEAYDYYQKTKTWVTPSGVVMEIPDDKAFPTPKILDALARQRGVSAPLGDVFEHPDLFKHQHFSPLQKNIFVDYIWNSPQRNATYIPWINTIRIRGNRSPDEMRQALGHEIQHVLQVMYGRPSGTNVHFIRQRVEDTPLGKEPQWQQLPEANKRTIAYYLYLLDPGEREARAVENRMMLSPGERKGAFPLQTDERLAPFSVRSPAGYPIVPPELEYESFRDLPGIERVARALIRRGQIGQLDSYGWVHQRNP